MRGPESWALGVCVSCQYYNRLSSYDCSAFSQTIRWSQIMRAWGKATLIGAPDADILLEVIEELRKKTTARPTTFSSKHFNFQRKVKAHRRKLANEEADIQADKAIQGKDVSKENHNRTNRAVFTWQESRRKGGKVSYADRKSTSNTGMWKAIRQGSASRIGKNKPCIHQPWQLTMIIPANTSLQTWYVIRDTWYMNHCTWYIIHDTVSFYMIHHTWYTIYVSWYMIHRILNVVLYVV